MYSKKKRLNPKRINRKRSKRTRSKRTKSKRTKSKRTRGGASQSAPARRRQRPLHLIQHNQNLQAEAEARRIAEEEATAEAAAAVAAAEAAAVAAEAAEEEAAYQQLILEQEDRERYRLFQNLYEVNNIPVSGPLLKEWVEPWQRNVYFSER